MIDRFTESNIQRAIINRLRRGPHTPESLSAMTGVELALTRYALNGLVALNRVVKNGVLYELVEPGRAA
ncbi:MAG TPA: hypothetical protein PJ986_04155 [Gammaproteobacteria bacterium]|nr:hypothetical protein [Gammaproteobacteria bacterium]